MDKAKDPYKAVDAAIDRINAGKLKAMPVSLARIGGSLYVQGTFPPKQGETHPKQRRIALELKAHVDFIHAAQQRALEIGADLMLGKWVWQEVPVPQVINAPILVKDFVEMHRFSYIERNGESDNKSDTEKYWQKDFLYPFRQLPQNKPLDLAMCVSAIGLTENHKRTRDRYVKAYRQLLTLAGIDAGSIDALRGNYKAAPVHPSSIPEVAQIIEWGAKIPGPWKFYYFLRANFGIRGTEGHPTTCRLDDLHDGAITVYGGKAKKWRYVPTCNNDLFHALWCEPYWEDRNRTPSQVSDDFTKVLKKTGCFFQPYGMRHHYAYRNLLDGIDTALSARYMGHSLQIHMDVYLLCIDKVRDRAIRQRHFPALSLPSIDRTIDS